MKYLSDLFCTCIITTTSDNILILNNELLNLNLNLNNSNNKNNDGTIYAQLIWMKLNDRIKKNFDKIIESNINAGCQAFIVDQSIGIDFLDSFTKVKDNCDQRVTHTHIIFIPIGTSIEIKMNKRLYDNIKDTILNHPSIYDLPNILIILPTPIQPSTSLLSTIKPTTLKNIIDNNKKQNINNKINNNNNNCVTFDLLTSKFVGRFNITSSILLDKLYCGNISFSYNVNLFPDKLSNLQQRIVKLAIFNYKPYTIWESVPPGYGNVNALNATDEKTLLIDGTESLMFLEFCIKYNCTLEISLDEKGEWGEIFENKTGNGVMGAVYERRADVGVGAMYTWYSVYLHLAISKPISRAGITCVTPSPELRAGWLMPILPFSNNLWLAVFISIIIGVLSLRLIKISQQKQSSFDVRNNITNESVTETILLVGGIYVLQSANIVTKHVPEIIILGCLLLIGMMIANAYCGGLSSLMTVPQYEESIDTTHQLATKTIEWGATHDAWIFSIQSAKQSDLVTLLSTFRTLSKETLQKRSIKRDFAFSIERLPFGHFAIGEYITEDALDYLQIMTEDIYWEYCVAMSSKTWPLLPKLDDLILRMSQSGVQKFWELKVVMKHENNNVQLGVAASRHHDSQGPVSLRPEHLVGVYIFWIIGLIASTIAFIFELICFHSKIFGKLIVEKNIKYRTDTLMKMPMSEMENTK